MVKKEELTPTERLANLNAQTVTTDEDEWLYSIPAIYAGVTYSEFATTSGLSKITVGHSDKQEVKTILEALHDALFDAVIAGGDHRPLREYLECGSLGRVSEVPIKMYGEYCGGTAQWMLMQEGSVGELVLRFLLSEFVLDLEVCFALPNLNPDCKCCVQGCLMKVVKVMHAGLEKTQVCDVRSRVVVIHDEIIHLMNNPRRQRRTSTITLLHSHVGMRSAR